MNDEILPGPLDRHFAALLERLHGSPDSIIRAAAETASAWRGAGHTCVPWRELRGESEVNQLRASPVVGEPGEFKPLILDSAGRLYLERYWRYETDLATAIQARLAPASFSPQILAAGLARLFPGAPTGDPQRRAAETAICQRFAVITGGPGTGKTFTAARVLALLADQFAAAGIEPRIALAAPTGKAAARLQESISTALASMPAGETLQRLSLGEARTIHRLLGAMPESTAFRHDRQRPLEIDAIIVDEASMVDVALMAKLFAAVPPGARVVLLGDKDQLASVEAGNVLGDICGGTAVDAKAPIAQHIVQLQQTRRFEGDSGIRELSLRVNAGDSEAALAALHSGRFADVGRRATPGASELEAALAPLLVAGCHGFLRAADPPEALSRMNDFRLLTATRRGPHGVQNLNEMAERILANAGLIAPQNLHYHGRPILITANDYHLKLFNGDVGLILRSPAADGELRAFFIDASGSLRSVLPARLPPHETSFAVTVHKSQGSEFRSVLLLLPDHDTPVATRELLYTGITRARTRVDLWAADIVLREVIARRTLRTSGLRDALWGGGKL